MSVIFKKNDDELVCEFSGRMDTMACMEIETIVNDKIDNHKGTVVFELKDVTYIASSFLYLPINLFASRVLKPKFFE